MCIKKKVLITKNHSNWESCTLSHLTQIFQIKNGFSNQVYWVGEKRLLLNRSKYLTSCDFFYSFYQRHSFQYFFFQEGCRSQLRRLAKLNVLTFTLPLFGLEALGSKLSKHPKIIHQSMFVFVRIYRIRMNNSG